MSEQQTIGSRLEEIMSDRRIKSRRAFALSIGADPSFFDKMIKGTASLTAAYADKIAEKYGVNKEWLYRGEMPKYVSVETKEPSPMQILAVLAQAFADQAAMMKSIESKMAQQADQLAIKEKVQATEARTERIESSLGEMEDKSSVAANLNFVVATVKKLSEIQNQAAAGLLDSSSQIEPAQNASSKDEYSSTGQSDGDGQKRGKPRAKRK